MAPSHVLVPLDGSPLADDALEHALEVYDCRTTVLNVVTPVDSTMSEGGILEADEDRTETAHDRAETVIDRARDQATAADRTVETAVETGDPAEAILEFLDVSEADHVVMGSHGGDRRPVLERLLGTVATTVVTESPVGVTVVR